MKGKFLLDKYLVNMSFSCLAQGNYTLCMVQFDLLPCPPGHTPGDLQFFSSLVVYSPPLGMQKESISHPGTSDRPNLRSFWVHLLQSEKDYGSTTEKRNLFRTFRNVL